MKKAVVSLISIVIAVLPCGPASAWSHANRWGGSTSHAEGSGSTTRSDAAGGNETHTYGQGTTANSRYGGTATHAEGSGSTTASNSYGTATHTYGQGTTATNNYGDTATHNYGGGTTVTNASGATAYGNAHYYGGAYGSYAHPAAGVPYYGAYHPPTSVNSYASGCYNCGGWATAGAAAAGAVAGAAVGAAVASAHTSAATSSAYSAGYTAGAVAATTYSIGEITAALPAGCASPSVEGKTYYLCGNTWFSPSYGANGVYYRVVPTP